MTNEEIFEKVKTHLLTQNAKSMIDGTCLYYGPNGLKCAVGCLIEDEHFDPEHNGKLVSDEVVLQMLHKSGIDAHGTGTLSLLRKLQFLHDHRPVSK